VKCFEAENFRYSGAQTLQTAHSYVGGELARRSASGGRGMDNHDNNVDSDSSVSSSSSDASASGLRRQYTLDSNPRRQHVSHSEAAESRPGVLTVEYFHFLIEM